MLNFFLVPVVMAQLPGTSPMDTTRTIIWTLETTQPDEDQPFIVFLHAPATSRDAATRANVRVTAPGKASLWLLPFRRTCSEDSAYADTYNPQATASWRASTDTILRLCVRIAGTRHTNLAAEFWLTRRDSMLQPKTVSTSGVVENGASEPLSSAWSLILSGIVGALGALIGSVAQHLLSVRQVEKEKNQARLDRVSDAIHRVLAEIDAELLDSRHQLRTLIETKTLPTRTFSEAGYSTLTDSGIASYLSKNRGEHYVRDATKQYRSIAEVNAALNALTTAVHEGKPEMELASLKEALMKCVEDADSILSHAIRSETS